MSNLYEGTELQHYGDRIDQCSRYLRFELVPNESGEVKHRLQDARFCRVRLCPICQWRRSLMWNARCQAAFPQILQDYPKARFIFLTLTVRNCEVGDLRSTLDKMNKAWHRMIGRKNFPAIGWMRNVEVTKGKDGTVHPHFHALLMVGPGYFSNHYLSQAKWIDIWKSCLRIDYQPSVRITTVKGGNAHSVKPENAHSGKTAPLPVDLLKAIRYTIKYSNKPQDLLGVEFGNRAHSSSEDAHSTRVKDTHNNSNNAHITLGDNTHSGNMADATWLVELTHQLHKTRAIALGGIFKEYLAEDEPEDLINSEDSEDPDQAGENSEATYFWNGSDFVLPFGTAAD